MNTDENLDYSLMELYKKSNVGGMHSIGQLFTDNDIELSKEDQKQIHNTLEMFKYAVFQSIGFGNFKGQITENGIEFVENSSFSKPDFKILDLKAEE